MVKPTDIIERAEETLEAFRKGEIHGITLGFFEQLLAALKAARAEQDQDLVDFAKNYAHLTTQLEAARAENKRLRDELNRKLCDD